MRAVAAAILLATLWALADCAVADHVPASAKGDEREARAIVDTVLQLLEKFRRSMKSPNSALGLPQLDPLQVSNVSLSLAVSQSQIALDLPRLKVEGLSTFVVEQLEVNVLFLRAKFGFSIADILATGAYSVDGRLLDLLSLFGSGDFRIEAMNFNVTDGLLQIGYMNDSIYIKNLTLDFNLDALKINLEGLFGGGDVGDIANRILNDVALDVVLDYKQRIVAYATDALVKKANSFLEGKSLDDLGHLLGGAAYSAPGAA